MAKVEETTLQSVERTCGSATCRGKVTQQKLIKRTEAGQPVRKVWHCTECGQREPAPANA
jgi:hypothetical protein